MLILCSTLPAATQIAAPRIAVSDGRCLDQFAAADLDNDGVLSDDEIGNAGFAMPSSVANRATVALDEFLACSKG
jgi:hypothetical protein